jgi:hypothetical protein
VYGFDVFQWDVKEGDVPTGVRRVVVFEQQDNSVKASIEEYIKMLYVNQKCGKWILKKREGLKSE